MEPIRIGDRVRVIDGRLVHYRQVGTVVATGTGNGWYVHLDYDDERSDARIFFHMEELEAVPEAPHPTRRAVHWSESVELELDPEPGTTADRSAQPHA